MVRPRRKTIPNFEAQRTNAEAYRARCEELLAMGFKPVVVEKAKHPGHWRDWREYYRSHGLLGSLDAMDATGRKSVPMLSPFEFEPVEERRFR